MRVGTKSVLFGVHCFLLHPWFVFAAWWKLYGFPWDPRLWFAFFLHDLGYWGKPNMDGPEGEKHVEWAAKMMHKWFDRPDRNCQACHGDGTHLEETKKKWQLYVRCTECGAWEWWHFCLYHSRFYAKRDRRRFSKLCVADKLAIALTPAWLYLPMVRLSGEIQEYMELARKREEASESQGKYVGMGISTDTQKNWYAGVQRYLREWAWTHRDCREDTWTPETEATVATTARAEHTV